MRTIHMRVVAFAILATLLGSCSESTTTTLPARTYHVGMVQWAAFSPLNVADVKGFWKDQGLNVVVDNFAVNSDLNNSLDSGKIDFALDMIGSWVDLRLQGKPLTVIGETDWSNGGDKIVIKDGTTPQSLKGQKFAIYLKLLSVENFVAKYLAANGLAMSDFNIVQEDDPKMLADKFINGEYSITANYDPEAQRAQDLGYGMVAATSRDYPGCIPEGFAARTDRLANIPQDDLVKFFTGWIKAVEWVQDTAKHWTEFKTILNTKTYPGSNYSDTELRGFMDNVKIHNKTDQLAANQTNGALYDYLTGLNTFAQSNGFAGKSFTPSQVFDNTAIIKALAK
jgi:NitT/TauT family transport system substrate-binding protein